MSSPSPTGMRGGAKKRKSGRFVMRADWSEDRTLFLVSILKEYNSPRHRAQNGWTKEAWNSMTQCVNDKFASANYLKDREQRQKKDYNAVKTILSKSGFGWNNVLKMPTTIDGKIAEGKHCKRSSEKTYKLEKQCYEEDYGQMTTPSPTIPAIPGSFVELVQGGIDLSTENGFEIEDSQYRTTAEDLADREAKYYSQTEAEFANIQERPKRKVSTDACAGQKERPEREKKKSKSNDNAMNELIALRKE
ncbi:hypothetical protein U9M48_007963 [Paspalum notatum var. saurae]|uniref:Myb/SANT-like domain-containing protein n=1 Tax=Paspalum notatum var. saurae TaxID=547442 RepID=A0AAQ3SN84_PASNO